MVSEIGAIEAQANDLFALLDELSDDEWNRDTRCPGWTVKELVAHLEGILDRMPETSEVKAKPEIDRAGYYGFDPNGPRDGEDQGKTFSEVVRDRVIDEVAGRSGSEITDSLRAMLGDKLAATRATPPDRVVQRPGNKPIRFDEFVATRVMEFGIHSMDISHATLRGERIHPDAVPIVVDILKRRLDAPLPNGMGWDDRTFILTGTGRRRLEPNERFILGNLAAKFPLLA
ncbi:MAG: maleylpyruvate isomerase family mycothiol-dependent enzyme [Actinomycetota bacterium]